MTDLRRAGLRRPEPGPRHGPAGRPRAPRRRLADGGPQHRPQLAAGRRHGPGPHDRADRRGRGRRDRVLAEGLGLGGGQRREPLRPDPRARGRRPRGSARRSRTCSGRATTSPTSSSCASPAPRSTATPRWSRPGHGGLERVIDLGVETGRPGRPRARHHPGQHPAGRGPRRGGRRHGRRDVRRRPGQTTMRVAGTFSKGSLINASYVMTLARLRGQRHLEARRRHPDDQRARRGPRRRQGRRSRRRWPTTPTSRSTTPPTSRARRAQSVDQLLGIVTALLLLAVVVAILGIVNTLVLSVVERTRELGLLRAVGGTRRQVRAVIRRESVLMSLLGALDRRRTRHAWRGSPSAGRWPTKASPPSPCRPSPWRSTCSSPWRWACWPRSARPVGPAGSTSSRPSPPSRNRTKEAI